VIWDLASRNGTFVNGQEIMSPTLLQENDEIRVGDTVFVLKTLA
jgi:pSer/pThr/pTyr-binding forkhead associated (FHA) protein